MAWSQLPPPPAIPQVSTMISDLLILLDRLQEEAFFFVEDGPLKHRLIERYLEEDEALGDILDFELDASLRIERQMGAADAAIEGRLEAGDFVYQTLLAVVDLDSEAIAELTAYLKPPCEPPSKPQARPGRNILRKKTGGGLLGIAQAATALGLCPRDLKALIPCSEVGIAEEDGEKTIEAYYWAKDLIDRLAALAVAQQQGRTASREDVTCIAAWCCDGDRQWAQELIAEFLQQRMRAGSSPRH